MTGNDEAFAQAYRDLEFDIEDLARSAKIMSYVAHHVKSDDDDNLTVHALERVFEEIMALKKKYDAAFKGEES